MNNQVKYQDDRIHYKWKILYFLVFFPPIISLRAMATPEDRVTVAVVFVATVLVYIIARLVLWKKDIYKSVMLHFLAFIPQILLLILVQQEIDKDSVAILIFVMLFAYAIARLVFRSKVGYWKW